MRIGLLMLMIVAALLVILSAVWVAVALTNAVWHVDRRVEGHREQDACEVRASGQ